MKDRLIELIRTASHELTTRCVGDCGDCSDKIADYIIADGWIRPPCKVGDKVYVIFKNEIYKATVFSMKIETEDDHYLTLIKVKVFDKISMFKVFIFGKSVFLTREEAEKALQEVKGK